VDLALLGLWYVCGIGAAALGAATRLGWRHLALLVAAFAGCTWWAGPGTLPTLSAAGVVAAVGAGAQLLRGISPVVSAVLAGALAGIWTGVLEAQGVPALLSPFVALAAPVAAAALAHRDDFAPDALRDEALLFLTLLGSVSAAAPVVHAGWRAAIDLNLRGGGGSAVALPVWAFALSAIAVMSGGLYTLWSRR
jgi:hypothetical protein